MLLNQLLNTLATWGWLIVVLGFLIYFLVTARTQGYGRALRRVFSFGTPLAVLLAFVLLLTLLKTLVFVEPTEVGVVVSIVSAGGIRERPLRSGLHLIVPFLEEVKRYPISTQTFTMSISDGNDAVTARTSDGQEVTIDCSTIFSIDPEQVIRLHIDFQDRYIEDFVRPVLRGIVRTQASQYKADEINSSKRLDLERDMDTEVRDTFIQRGLQVDRFILRNITFSPEYAASIEAKQVALQDTIKRQHEADQLRIQAQGESDAASTRVQGEADAIRQRATAEADGLRAIAAVLATNPNLLNYQYISKLGPDIRVMLVPSNAPYLLPLPSLDGSRPITATATLTTTTPLTSTAPLAPTRTLPTTVLSTVAGAPASTPEPGR